LLAAKDNRESPKLIVLALTIVVLPVRVKLPRIDTSDWKVTGELVIAATAVLVPDNPTCRLAILAP
jgi:hypothetical protein